MTDWHVRDTDDNRGAHISFKYGSIKQTETVNVSAL